MAASPLPPAQYRFPDPIQADPLGEGLIATGGDLAPATIWQAYQQGLFPWFNADDPICWWSPEPRCVIYPDQFKPSKSLIRQIKKNQYHITLSHAFEQVIHACADTRAYAEGTWINPDIIAGYTGLYEVGLAHSIEVWQQDTLVGGLYGVQLGAGFFGESMFSRQTDVSKMAFYFLMKLCAASGMLWVDCQLPNDHLMSLGATTLPRATFLAQLQRVTAAPAPDWEEIQHRRYAVVELLDDA
ncbi:MAG: leucyl/phenylalanyl-tRNA--protein transferase, partial [Pseudomonadota bacterium]|nr:leucyl/phenylalanyl-tRNA--protein transferase [Pseudomonadota bacterium]